MKQLMQALGPPAPDIGKAAAKLGVTEQALKTAVGVS